MCCIAAHHIASRTHARARTHTSHVTRNPRGKIFNPTHFHPARHRAAAAAAAAAAARTEAAFQPQRPSARAAVPRLAPRTGLGAELALNAWPGSVESVPRNEGEARPPRHEAKVKPRLRVTKRRCSPCSASRSEGEARPPRHEAKVEPVLRVTKRR